MILTVLDAMGIQDYIFRSNRLRDNIGASELVDAALSRWPIEVLQTFGHVNPAKDYLPDENVSLLREDALDAELFYAGGGIATILFPDMCKAKKFARAYSRKVLSEAPGFRAACVHYRVEKDLATSLEEALAALAARKAAYEPGVPALGLGVSLPCVVTGLPARPPDTPEDNEQPLSMEMAVKRSDSVVDQARDRMREVASNLNSPHRLDDGTELGPFALPSNFDELGRTEGETSYIGVVHVDGNGMGQRIADLVDQYRDPAKNRDYLAAMRRLSQDINRGGEQAVQALLSYVMNAIGRSKRDQKLKVADAVEIRKGRKTEKDRWMLPIRLLVYGGDDITFVCDGRLALDLAAHVLEALQNFRPDSFGENGLNACAGVAIVKTHYPFSRAYRMAEALCDGAKEYLRSSDDGLSGASASVLDWHLTAGGVQTDIKAIRKREYQLGNDVWLTQRPYVLPQEGLDIPDGHDWTWFRNTILDGLVDPEACWAEHRTQLKETLARAVRSGPDTTEIELDRLRIKGYTLPGGDPWSKRGFGDDKRTPYLDALEMTDMVPHSSAWNRREARS